MSTRGAIPEADYAGYDVPSEALETDTVECSTALRERATLLSLQVPGGRSTVQPTAREIVSSYPADLPL
jgi:hypothetical protein